MSTDSSQTASSASAVAALPDDQRAQYEQILDELMPYLEADTPSPAVHKIDRFLDEIPDDDRHARLRSGLLAQRASFYLDLDLDERALQDIERAIDGGWRDADTCSTAGWAAYAIDKPGMARDYFDSALELDADHVPALTGRGLALIEIEEYDLARSDLTHAISLDPSSDELYSLRAEAMIGLRDLDKAESDVRKALEIAPGDPDHAFALTRLLLVRGDVEEAREAIGDAVDEEGPALEGLLLRSHLRMLAGDSSEARRDAIRASNHYPDEAFAFVQLVHVELAEGNLSLARKAANRAVKLDSSLPDAYMVRGATLQMQGKQQEAREDLERASQAPAELPMFLLGSFYDVLESSGFNHSMMDLLDQYTAMHEEGGPTPGPGAGQFDGFDPEEVMDRVFDENGDIDDQVKPFVEMALENAPNILKNLPPGLIQGLGGVDPDQLDDMDLEELSSDEIEQQLKEFYKMMQSGGNPFDMFDDGFDGSPNDSDSDDDGP
jgi:tetratricopeptide (TPR) repeat protein